MVTSVTDRIRGSYAAKIAVAFGLIVVVVGGFALVSVQSTTQLVKDEQTTQLTNDARQQAEALEQWTGQIETSAASLAATDAVESGDTEAVESVLATRSESLPDGVVAIHYLSEEGVAASTAADASLPQAVTAAAGGSEPMYTEPFDSRVTDGGVTAYVVPTESGALVYELDVTAITAELSSGQGVGQLVVVDESRRLLAAPEADRIGETHSEMGGLVPSVAGGDGEPGIRDRGDSVMAYAGIEGAPWAVMVHASDSKAFAVAEQVESSIVGIVLIGVVSLVLFGSTVGSTTIIQMRDLSGRAEQVAAGDLDVSFPTRRSDEFGDVRRQLDRMRGTLIEEIEAAESAQQDADRARREAEELSEAVTVAATEYAAELEAAADGDLTRRLDPDADTHESMRRVGTAVDELLADYQETIRELSAFADDVAGAAEEVTDATGDVAGVSQRLTRRLESIQDDSGTQRDQIQELTEELGGLSATAEEIAASSQEVETASQTAAAAAEQGTDAAESAIEEMDETVTAIDETVTAVDQLDQQVDRVTEVVDLIQDIADETNTLALNASIEAARAGGEGGAAGDGFAVVADEVKALAEETKQSAAEISEQLTAIREGTATAVEAAEGADETISAATDTVNEALTQLDEIADHVADTDESIREISRATADQAESAQQASGAVDDVREISEQTAGDAADLAGSAREQLEIVETVEQTAGQLTQEASRLQSSLDGFDIGDETPAHSPNRAAGVTDDD